MDSDGDGEHQDVYFDRCGVGFRSERSGCRTASRGSGLRLLEENLSLIDLLQAKGEVVKSVSLKLDSYLQLSFT